MIQPPILIMDSRERWWPVGVEESLAASGVKVPRSAAGRFPDSLKRDRVGRADRLDFPDDMTQPPLPAVGYHRQVNRQGLHWHQYWFWYLYNPKAYVGFGRHEGDWEFVQLAYTYDLKPVLATASQHGSGGKREAWDMEWREGRPVFYVARDSHANYFQPGRTLEDYTDGAGRVLRDIEWRQFGARTNWAHWRGRWGNSIQEGKSPESPAHQEERWGRPHVFHTKARP